MKKFALILMMIAVLAVPATAIAADGYTNVAGVNQGGGSNETSAPAAVASAGGSDEGLLPFTGLELALMFGSGVVLLGTGILLRRAHSR